VCVALLRGKQHVPRRILSESLIHSKAKRKVSPKVFRGFIYESPDSGQVAASLLTHLTAKIEQAAKNDNHHFF
jgi:hypothetical protein